MKLTLNNRPYVIAPTADFTYKWSMHSGLNHDQAVGLAIAVSEMVTDIVHFAFGNKVGEFEISFVNHEDRIEIIIHEFGVPFNPDKHKYDVQRMIEAGDFDGAGFRLAKNLVDNFVFLNKGKAGKEFRILQEKSPERLAQQLASLTEYVVEKPPPQTYHVEAALPDHAEEIAKLIYRTYEHTYYKDVMYFPEKIERSLEQKEKFAVLTRAENGEVVGYFAVLLNLDSNIGEVGEAVVALPHRRRGIMKMMLNRLIEMAHERGLYGVFGEANAAHLFSQKANARFGFVSCALMLGMCPPFNTEGIDPKWRDEPVSVIFEYKPLTKEHVLDLYLPPSYKNIIKRIYKRLDIDVKDTRLPTKLFEGASEIDVQIKYSGQFVEIAILKYGADFTEQLTRIIGDLEAQQFTTFFIDLPLELPETKKVASELKGYGFVFSGLMPMFHGNRDHLRMQRTSHKINFDLILVHTPLGKAIKKIVQAEAL